jgi:hypothetical protein
MHRHGSHAPQEQAERRMSQRQVVNLERDLDHGPARTCRNQVGVSPLGLLA